MKKGIPILMFITLVLLMCCLKKSDRIETVTGDYVEKITGKEIEEIKGEVNILMEAGQKVKEEIDLFFDGADYSTIEKPLVVKNRHIFFSLHMVKENIFDSAIAYEIQGDMIRKYLEIRNFVFYNEDESVIWDFAKGNKDIFGFSISYSYPLTNNTATGPAGFDLTTYFEEGKRPADNVIFNWNEDEMKFKIFDPMKR